MRKGYALTSFIILMRRCYNAVSEPPASAAQPRPRSHGADALLPAGAGHSLALAGGFLLSYESCSPQARFAVFPAMRDYVPASWAHLAIIPLSSLLACPCPVAVPHALTLADLFPCAGEASPVHGRRLSCPKGDP